MAIHPNDSVANCAQTFTHFISIAQWSVPPFTIWWSLSLSHSPWYQSTRCRCHQQEAHPTVEIFKSLRSFDLAILYFRYFIFVSHPRLSTKQLACDVKVKNPNIRQMFVHQNQWVNCGFSDSKVNYCNRSWTNGGMIYRVRECVCVYVDDPIGTGRSHY